MLILGINAFHPDAAACLVADGEIVAAAEEERFVRRKHFAGFPAHAARWCLEFAGAPPGELEAVALNTDPRAARLARLAAALRHPPSPALVRERLRARARRADVRTLLEQALDAPLPRVRQVHVEHHRAHLAAAFYCSPFDRAAVVSVDGFGDFSSAAVGLPPLSSICTWRFLKVVRP